MHPINVNAPVATISATTSSSRVAYGETDRNHVLVKNASSVTIFVKSGSSSVTAATTDMPILPGEISEYTKAPGDTHMAGITASGSGTIYVIAGESSAN